MADEDDDTDIIFYSSDVEENFPIQATSPVLITKSQDERERFQYRECFTFSHEEDEEGIFEPCIDSPKLSQGQICDSELLSDDSDEGSLIYSSPDEAEDDKEQIYEFDDGVAISPILQSGHSGSPQGTHVKSHDDLSAALTQLSNCRVTFPPNVTSEQRR